ncbi:MAG: YdcF family protein [Ferruginibacter sp.]
MFPKINCRYYFVYFQVICCLISLSSFSQKNSPDPKYQLIKGNNFVQSKNYYLLTLFQQLPEVKKLLEADEILAGITTIKSDSLSAGLMNCGRDGLCYLNRMRFTETEIKKVSERLNDLYQPQNALGKLVRDHLVPSGYYVLFQNISPKEMLLKAWEQDANGINFCIGVYAGGNKPNYPLIDSISFNTKDPRNTNTYPYNYVGLLYNTTSLVAVESNGNKLFFYPSLTFALHFLEMNEREQAADFEPMAKGENKPAADRIKNINWQSYKYSVIMIPGAGPDEPQVALSAEGMLRCRLAAIQYKKGLAPFIVTSGGKVHPYKTKFCEATEMKQYMIEKLGIPANAIIIDPHARHTTTNMRNTARLMFRYGMPFDKPGITCTTKGQSNMIGNTLIARCIKELNEAPYKNGVRLSETEIEFYPLIEALHINPTEPIDP